MPSNICLHSFAQQVRDLVAEHPEGITDTDVARRLDVLPSRVRTTVRDDGKMIVTDPFFVTQLTDTGDEEVYFPRTDRTDYTYRPRTTVPLNGAECIGVIKPAEATRREKFEEMRDRMVAELAQRYLDDAPAVGISLAMAFGAKVRALAAGSQP